MKREVSKFKKHNVCNTDNWEAATRCFTKKPALKNSETPTGKHLRWSVYAINSQAISRATLSKREAKTGALPHSLPPRTMKSPRTFILKNALERLPPIIHTLSIPFLSKISCKLSQSLQKDYYHIRILLSSDSWY